MISRKLHRRFAVRAMLALILLVAQVGAQQHAYFHMRAEPAAGGFFGLATQVCAECLSFAPLLAAVSSSDYTVAFHFVAAQPALCSAIVSFADCFRHPAFRSRAPPHLV